MAYVYKRGGIWWCRIKDKSTNEWLSSSTETRVDDPLGKRKAKKIAEAAQRKRDAKCAAGGTAPIASDDLTVSAYAIPGWIEKRRGLDLDYKNDESRLRHHVLPYIGHMPIADVCPKHLADLVRRWRTTPLESTGEVMSQRTVYNVHSVVSAMFRDAAVDGVIEHNPTREIGKAQLGPLVDSDPEWRDGSVFEREEAETLISDERISFDRRLYYALGLLAGLRPGEIAALRVRHYDSTIKPLGRLTVALALNTRKMTIKGTKTNAVRKVPVHPTLAAILGEWLLSGWAAMMGHTPTADDLLVPLPPADAARRRARTGEPIRTGDYAGKKWREVDLPMLGWRGRELYAGKSTFITLAIEDGADEDVIRQRVTHAKARRNAFDGYDRGEHWARTCAEVAKLKLSRKPAARRLVALAQAAALD